MQRNFETKSSNNNNDPNNGATSMENLRSGAKILTKQQEKTPIGPEKVVAATEPLLAPNSKRPQTKIDFFAHHQATNNREQIREAAENCRQRQQQQPTKMQSAPLVDGAAKSRKLAGGSSPRKSRSVNRNEKRVKLQEHYQDSKLNCSDEDKATPSERQQEQQDTSDQKQEEEKQLRLGSAELSSAACSPTSGDSTSTGSVADSSSSSSTASSSENICAACLKPIKERYLLMALDKQWHEDCLKCACCDCRLGEVGSSLFTHSDKILCRRDFLRIFGQHGHCAACKKSIPPYEMVMRANENAYHMECFACQQCQYRFCVGDRFHLTDAHRIVCILCHSEQQQLQLHQQQPNQTTTQNQHLHLNHHHHHQQHQPYHLRSISAQPPAPAGQGAEPMAAPGVAAPPIYGGQSPPPPPPVAAMHNGSGPGANSSSREPSEPASSQNPFLFDTSDAAAAAAPSEQRPPKLHQAQQGQPMKQQQAAACAM